jgi:hypothetical protein
MAGAIFAIRFELAERVHGQMAAGIQPIRVIKQAGKPRDRAADGGKRVKAEKTITSRMRSAPARKYSWV